MASIFDLQQSQQQAAAPTSLGGALAQKQASQQPIRTNGAQNTAAVAANGARQNQLLTQQRPSTAPFNNPAGASVPAPPASVASPNVANSGGVAGSLLTGLRNAVQTTANVAGQPPAPQAPRDPLAPQGVDMYTPGALISQQYRQGAPSMQAAQQLSQDLRDQGAGIRASQTGQAASFDRRGQEFQATAPLTAGRFGVGDQVSLAGGPAAPAALSTSQLGVAPSIGQVGNVAGQLGGTPQAAGVGNIAGQLGGAPGAVNPNGLGAISQVAGQLGGGYQVGSVGNIAGRLGAAPSVGQVGNIQMAGGPGAVMPQLGNQGAFNADQAGMLQRLNGFLDAPDGPSVAAAQLQQSQADNMANLIGAARSGRGGAGAQAQALRGAMSEGSAIMSDTAGQLATLRAQEEDMIRNRQLSAIGLGGQMAEAQRAQDLGFRGQDLAALQGDQIAALGARGQDLQAAMANQSTQTALEQLQAQTALGARAQNLSALQGDQSTALGLEGLRANTAVANRGQDLGALTADQQASIAARGQNLSALQGNQQTALGARAQDLSALQGDQATQAQMSLGNLQAALTGRGQDLSALQGDQSTALGREGLAAQTALGARAQDLSLLQGNQQTALGARGQDVTRELGLQNVNLGMRGQDAGVLAADADRVLAAQRLGLDAGLGYGNLANQANQMGLNYLSQANQQALGAQGLSQDMMQSMQTNQTSLVNNALAAQAGLQQQALANSAQPSFGEQLALNVFGGLAAGAGQGLAAKAASDERAKEDIQGLDSIKSQLDEHLRASPGFGYRYKPGFGEDPDTPRAGPMAQDLERSPFGKDIVVTEPSGLKMVDTRRLALVDHAALSAMRSELDELKKMLEA